MTYAAEELLENLSELKTDVKIAYENKTAAQYKNKLIRLGAFVTANFDAIADIIRRQGERDNPQPLTLDQLRGRSGNPVWVQNTETKRKEGFWDEWALVNIPKGTAESVITIYRVEFYGKTWVAYDYPPKGAQS